MGLLLIDLGERRVEFHVLRIAGLFLEGELDSVVEYLKKSNLARVLMAQLYVAK